MAGLLSRLQQRKKRETACSAVIVAAGMASRMEGIDKILAPLGELPVLVHTLGVFQDCPLVQEIVVVTREDLLVEVSRMCRDYGMDKVSKVVVGGAERIHSVRSGLQEVRPDTQLIAIHDGARPLVTLDILKQTILRAGETGAAAPAIPIVDTVKRAEGDMAVETVDRSALRAIQTPQVFQADLIRAAVQKALEDGESVTDDCAAVVRLGRKVALTRGSRENLKITTPFDLLLGEAILEARGRGEL